MQEATGFLILKIFLQDSLQKLKTYEDVITVKVVYRAINVSGILKSR